MTRQPTDPRELNEYMNNKLTELENFLCSLDVYEPTAVQLTLKLVVNTISNVAKISHKEAMIRLIGVLKEFIENDMADK